MKHIQSIQALRGIAVLGVVALHSLSIEYKYSGGDQLLPDFFRLGQSGVDLFFVISGFVMVLITKNNFSRTGEVKKFLWSRFTRIYPTYWVYFLLTAFIFLFKPEWFNASQGHQADILASFLLLPSDQIPLVMVSWSLVHELWFYLVFSVFLKFRESFLLPALLLWAAIVITANIFINIFAVSPVTRIILHPYSLEFIIGALIAIFISGKNRTLISSRNAILILVVTTSVAVFTGLRTIYSLDILKQESVVRAMTVGVTYGLLLFSAVTLEAANRFTAPKFLQIIGDMSYTIYLSHILVLSAIGRLWLMTGSDANSLTDNMLVCLIMLVAVLAYGWLGYRLIEQPFVKTSHALRNHWFGGNQ